jgi:hypothetical protein
MAGSVERGDGVHIDRPGGIDLLAEYVLEDLEAEFCW